VPSSARTPLTVAAAPDVDGCPSVAYMRHAPAGGRRPRFLDGATPCSSASFRRRRLGTYLLAAERQAHAQHSAGWRRRRASLSPWGSTLFYSEGTASASTVSPSQWCPRACANVPPRP